MMMQRGAVGSVVLTAVALTAVVGVAAAAPAPEKAASVSHGEVTDNLYMSLGAFEDATSGEDPKACPVNDL